MIYRGNEALEKLTEAMGELKIGFRTKANNVSALQHVIFEKYKSVGVTVLSQQPFSFYWDTGKEIQENINHLLLLFRSTVDYSLKSRCYALMNDKPNVLPKDWETVLDMLIGLSYNNNIKVNIPENLHQHSRFNIVLFHSFKMPRWDSSMPIIVTTILDMPFEWIILDYIDVFDC